MVAPCGATTYAYSRLRCSGLLDTDDSPVAPKKLLRSNSHKSRKTTNIKDSDKVIECPIPNDLVSFNRCEAIELLKDRGPEKSQIINYWVMKKYIPVSRQQMYKYLRDHKDSNCETDWKTRGRKPILSVTKVVSTSARFLEKEGKPISSIDIEKVLKEKRIEKESELGYAGEVLDEPSPQTRRNYQTAFATINCSLGNFCTVQQKTGTRFTMENSLVSTMAYTIAVAVNNFSIGIPLVSNLRALYTDWTPDSSIPEELFAASWSDGGGPQLKASVDEKSLKRDSILQVYSAKNNTARTGCEQPADKISTFCSLNEYSRNPTAEE